jgi:hypothetical protein
MQRGSTITVFSNGLRVSEENLATIGVFDGSTCWGLWVPDRNRWPYETTGDEVATPEHFLISPFEPSSWPILFRVEMFLNNDRPGTLADALAPLAKEGLSIVSIEATPAGHHHAAVTIIGEAMPLKEPNGVLSYLKTTSPFLRTFRNETTWKYVHEVYAPTMLRYCKQITEAVELADNHQPFLREIFLDSRHARFERGVLYSYADLSSEGDRALGFEQRTRAVRCTWLQNLAFFWLYGRGDAMQLHYKSRGQSLKPALPDRPGFGKVLAPFHPPFRAIASFNLLERFLRVVLSSCDLPKRTARITIPFSAKYRPFQGSRGFQHDLYALLKEKGGLNLREVTMLTRRRNLEEEEGELSLLVSKVKTHLDPSFGSLDEMRSRVQEIANEAAAGMSRIDCKMTCDPVAVQRFEAPLLFFSTKFEWMRGDHPNLLQRIDKVAREVGFRLVMGDMERRAELEAIVPEMATEQYVTGAAIKLIQHSSAFLQIIPKRVLERGQGLRGSMNWLEFEFGAAQALEIPCALLVDLGAGDIFRWKKQLRVANDFPLFGFYGSGTDDAFDAEIEKAVSQLGYLRRRRKLP